MRSARGALVFGALVSALGSACAFVPTVIEPGPLTPLRGWEGSTLYSLSAAGYDDPILVLNITGRTRYDIGYAYG